MTLQTAIVWKRFFLAQYIQIKKLSQIIAIPSITARTAAKDLLSYWVFPDGIQNYLLTENGRQLVKNFFDIVLAMLGTTHMTTKRYQMKI